MFLLSYFLVPVVIIALPRQGLVLSQPDVTERFRTRGNVLRKIIFHKRREGKGRQKLPVRARMPVHPGAVLRERYLLPRGISSDDFADALGVYDQVILQIVSERGRVTHLMAGKLARHLGTTPEFWIKLQSSYDSAIG